MPFVLLTLTQIIALATLRETIKQTNMFLFVLFSRAFPHVYWLLEPEEIIIAYLKISQIQPPQQQKMFVVRLENGGLSKHILH